MVRDTTLPDVVPKSHRTPARETTNKLFSLSGRTIVITGAGQGLGITLTAAVLEAGGNVACLDILCEPSKSEWSSLQRTAKASAFHVSYHKCDIANEDEVRRELGDVDIVTQRLGAPFYGLVVCAGIQQQMPALEYAAADFERILRVNVTGTFLTAKHAARIMIKNGVQGSIIMIASMSGNQGIDVIQG